MSASPKLTTAASRYEYYQESKPAGTIEKCAPCIENYIYLHHVNQFLILPQYMDNVSDSQSISFQQVPSLGRSAPTYVYSNSGPRTITIQISNLHRELMQQINSNVSNATFTDPGDDYVDYFIKAIQACAYPKYDAGQKLIDPPLVSLKMSDDIYIKGIVNGSVSVGYNLPILRNNKYGMVSINFSISEVDPYDADMVMDVGSYRNNGEIPLNISMNSSNVYQMANPRNTSGSTSTTKYGSI